MPNEYDEVNRRAVETAKSVFGERKNAQIEAIFADKESLMKLYGSLGERDRKTVEAVLRNPQMLKNILSSPKAMEGLQKLLGETRNG